MVGRGPDESKRAKARAIGCGQYHTAVLLASGEVYSAGSNQYGACGISDELAQVCPAGVFTLHAVRLQAQGSLPDTAQADVCDTAFPDMTYPTTGLMQHEVAAA